MARVRWPVRLPGVHQQRGLAGGLFTGAEGINTEEEAAIWGGIAGEQYDPCYHLACDTIENVSPEALDVNIDAIAHTTFHYAVNFDEFPELAAATSTAGASSVPAMDHRPRRLIGATMT